MRHLLAMILAASPALAEVPQVVTDIPPVHALVAQVMGDLGAPVLLLERGADEHDFQLRPSQMGAVAEAGLVVWIGPELTPWLADALQARGEGGASLPLLAAEGTRRRSFVDDDGHDHGGTDPHAWLDPGNATLWLNLIAGELSHLDPANAATYAANARAAQGRIEAMDGQVAALLAPFAKAPVVTFHDAYGYFFAHYGLTLADTVALGDAAAPGAARLSELRATMKTGAVLCIFPEVQHDPALVEQMAEGTGARIGGALDPVGAMLEPGPDAYAALITGTAQVLADCLAD